MTDDRDVQTGEAWLMAGDRLGVRVTAPYAVSSARFIAYLPDFGGPDGMVLAATQRAESDGLTSAAARAGLYLSRVSNAYADFDPDMFKETLDDWGWYGVEQDRPDWYSGRPWTT